MERNGETPHTGIEGLEVIQVGQNESPQEGPINSEWRVAPSLHKAEQKSDGEKPHDRRTHKSKKQPRLIWGMEDFVRFQYPGPRNDGNRKKKRKIGRVPPLSTPKLAPW
jgi:hypothetical protein